MNDKSKISKAIKLGMIALKGIENNDKAALSFLSYCISYAKNSDKKSRLKDCEIFEKLVSA